MDDNFTPHDELVNRIRPFVHRYVAAHPIVLTLWMGERITLTKIHDIMADFWGMDTTR